MTGWSKRPFAVDGLTLSLAERGKGRPFIFQHGLGGDARQTAESLPVLPGWTAATLECRGHGGSPLGEAHDISIPHFAADVAAYVAQQKEPAVLGGISMGAAIALRLAVLMPERVRALVLVRPAWLFAPEPGNLQPYREVGVLLSEMDQESGRIAFLRSKSAAILQEQSPDNLASLLGFFDREPHATATLLSRIAADGPGITEAQARALSLPVLVIGQPRDLAHPLAMAKQLAAIIPGTRLAVVASKGDDRAAHFAALHAAITDFLENLP